MCFTNKIESNYANFLFKTVFLLCENTRIRANTQLTTPMTRDGRIQELEGPKAHNR